MPRRSQQREWFDRLPPETFFRHDEVPGPTSDAVHAFLTREASRSDPERRLERVVRGVYYKLGDINMFTGRRIGPSRSSIGWELSGPHAGALGWYGANIVGWSTQMPWAFAFAVPGTPGSRHPYRGISLRGRRNPRRAEMSTLEATYLESVIGFDRWAEFEQWFEDWWATALDATRMIMRRRIADDRQLPRGDVLRYVAEAERPLDSPRSLFRDRIDSLAAVFEEFSHGT